MPIVTPILALIILAAGIVSGGLGALLGLGGGIFLVPFLNLGMKFPFAAAAAISLTTIIASFVAGNLSSLLGIGGGFIKVPVLNAWCGVPMRAAAATSAFMIGVTATSGAVIYYGQGQLQPALAAVAVLGVQIGSWSRMQFGAAASAKWLK